MDDWIEEFYSVRGGIVKTNDIQKELLAGNAPKVLYQYRSIEQHNVDNIKNGVIWARKASDFNDPYDCLISSTAIEQQIALAKKNNNEELLTELEDLQKAFLEEAQKCRTMTAISCFSNSCTSLLMWSHYANQHEGMCVEYDYKKLEKISHKSILPVSYGDKIDIFSQNKNRNNLLSHMAFIRKAKDWKYEEEWRIIALLIDTTIALTIKAPMPEKIIFGSKTDYSKPLVKDLINFAEKNGIVCSKMSLDKDIFKLNEGLLRE